MNIEGNKLICKNKALDLSEWMIQSLSHNFYNGSFEISFVNINTIYSLDSKEIECVTVKANSIQSAFEEALSHIEEGKTTKIEKEYG